VPYGATFGLLVGHLREINIAYESGSRVTCRASKTDTTSRFCGSLGQKEEAVFKLLSQLCSDERGQDIAEYAVMLAVILVIVVGTVRLIGSNANNVFSSVGSAIQ
jgi:Flp pilus assembly pilin Flp